MAALPVIAAIVTGAAAVGSTALQYVQSRDAEKRAKGEMEAQARTAQQQQDKLEKSSTGLSGLAAEAQRRAAARQQQRSRAATGARGTILTSPLGSVGEAATGGKTLLGS